MLLPAASRASWFWSGCCALLVWIGIELFPVLLLRLGKGCWNKDEEFRIISKDWKRWFEIKGDFSWLFCDWFLRDNI